MRRAGGGAILPAMRFSLATVLLLGCAGDDGKDSRPGDTDTPGDDSGDTDDTGGADPYDCGTIPAAPNPPSDQWTSAGPVEAGTILTFATAAGRAFPLYAAGSRTGGWRADDATFTWDPLPVVRYHAYADLVVDENDPMRVLHSAGGMLQRSEDGGASWEAMPLGSVSMEGGAEVELVLGLAGRGSEAWAVLSTGEALYSPDFGYTWESRGDTGVEMMMEGWAFDWRLTGPGPDGETLFFTEGENLYRSPDGGRNWQPVRPDLVYPRAVARAPDGRVAVGYGSGYAVTDDDGETWTETEVGEPITVTAFSASGRLAVGNHARIWVDGVVHDLPADPLILAAVEETWLVGHDEGVEVSTDDGATWRHMADHMTDDGMSVIMSHPVCPNRVYLGSRCTGGIYISEDWGRTWPHVDDYFHYVMSLHFDPADPDHVWAVSDDRLDESWDGGQSWRVLEQSYHFHGFASHPENSDVLLLGSVGSGEWADSTMRVYKTTDGGLTWTDSSTGLPDSEASAHTIVFWPTDPDVVLLGTYKGNDASHQFGEGIGLFRSADGGASWAYVDTLPVTDVAWLEPAGDAVWAATNDGAWSTTDGGVTWTRADGVNGVILSVDFVGDLGLAYADNATVYRTDDGGASWAPYGVGLPPSGGTTLAQVAIALDQSMAWVTVFGSGVFQIGL